MGEFDLIARYFKRTARHAALGVGDDCALLQPKDGTQLTLSTDMLVERQHFFSDVDPYTLGHKALAVNLSDLAACGAKPLAFMLALSLASADEAWLAAFSQGLWALADVFDCDLIGGDTTRGPLTVCITVIGEVPVLAGRSTALLRSGAKPGEDVYVSGTLGDARLALDALLGRINVPADVLTLARARLEMPTPRIALGIALRGIATAAIDLSDGLLGDLGHLLKSSQIGCTINADIATKLVAAQAYSAGAGGQFDLPFSSEQWRTLALSGGDDYELLFTAPRQHRPAVAAAAKASQTRVTCIGITEAMPGLRLVDGQGCRLPNTYTSFDHFALFNQREVESDEW